MIFDIQPEHGNRILMDGFPGVITSDDDFGVNSAGMMITETTITQFEGWDPERQARVHALAQGAAVRQQH